MASFNGTMTYEGDQPSDTIIQEATRLAISTRAMRDHAGLPRMIKAYDLVGGEQVYVLDMEHTWRVHVVCPVTEEPVSTPLLGPLSDRGNAPLPIAGFVSGVGFGTTIEWKEVSWPDVGQDDNFNLPGVPYGEVPTIVNDAFSLVRESAELFPKDQASHKLAAPLNNIFVTVGDENARNQFHRVVPGRYTGGMAAIVQLLLGVGRIVYPDYEERWRERNNQPPLYPEAIDEIGYGFQYDEAGVTHETGEIIDSSYTPQSDSSGEPPDTLFSKRGQMVQISYDYRWNRTHGVMWGQGNDGKRRPMLVELAQRGIHVMEFPVDELSTMETVQEHYKKVYPKLEAFRPFRGRSETLFDAFGGFPTGENIPGYHVEFDRWKRAGAVIESPQDLSDFYSGGISMCTGFGWAFHPSQPKAINTAYKYENGHKVGYCHQVQLDIREKPDNAKVRNPRFSDTVAALGLTDKIDIFKAARLPENFAEEMIEEPDYDAFDEFQVEPDWIVSANVIRTGEGIIDYPFFQCPQPPGGLCDVIGSPHFKYYEPMLGEVLNFEFFNFNKWGDKFVADGPIFATYRDSGVEILNYYYEPAKNEREEFNTRQICQFTGQWEHGHYSDGTQLRGYFYCTSRDFRKKVATGGGSRTKVTGRRIGQADFISFCAFFGIHSTSRKHFFGTETWERETWSGHRYHVSVTASANNRSAFLVCWEQSKTENRHSRGFSGRKMLGSSGTIRQGRINNWLWHWVGCASWSCPSTDSPCIHRTCNVVTNNPNSCHGVEPPSDIQYSVCPVSSNAGAGPYTVVSPVGPGNIIVSAYYTPVPEAPPSWSETDPPQWEFEWEVWAFGLDLMNNRRVKRFKEVITDPQAVPQRSSHTSWWRCSIPGQCPAPAWFVGENFFGRPIVSAYDDIDPQKVVDFGAKPSVGFGPMSVPFGVVD